MPSNFPTGLDSSTFVADPGTGGAIPLVDAQGLASSTDCSIVTAGAEPRSIAAPAFSGQQCRIFFLTDGGDCTITVASGFDSQNNNTLTLDTANDSLTLEAFSTSAKDTLRWALTHNDGVVASTV